MGIPVTGNAVCGKYTKKFYPGKKNLLGVKITRSNCLIYRHIKAFKAHG